MTCIINFEAVAASPRQMLLRNKVFSWFGLKVNEHLFYKLRRLLATMLCLIFGSLIFFYTFKRDS